VASAAVPPEEEPAEIAFDLPADNGLRAHLETFNGEVTLEIQRKGRFVAYEVEGEPTEAGLKAKFGKLGLIDVAFTPTKTRTEEPPKGCEGEPSTSSEGLFTGTIQFTGERGFVRIESAQVEGSLSVWRESEWRCPREKGEITPPEIRRQSDLLPRQQPEAEKEPATLAALNHRCRCYFAAYAERTPKGRGPSIFYGVKFEEREGMEITRGTFVRAGAAAFVFDHAAGTARVDPPHPFSGNGFFKRRPKARDIWRSTIRVPILGADPLSFRGRGFRARLVRALPGD
jgi:hypothetical protein